MAKKRVRRVRRAWSKDDIKELKAHSRAKTPIVKIAKETKRSALALRLSRLSETQLLSSQFTKNAMRSNA